jgi:hypothetical protein
MTLVGVLALVAGLVGCGGSSPPPKVTAAAYVGAVCGTVGPFEKQLTTRSQAFNPSAIKTPAQGRAVLKTFLSGVAGDTDTALSRLKAAGIPKVTGGANIYTRIVSAFTSLDTTMKQAAHDADTLPTTNDAAFKTAATKLVSTVQRSLKTIGPSLSGLKSSALITAARKAPACVALNG